MRRVLEKCYACREKWSIVWFVIFGRSLLDSLRAELSADHGVARIFFRNGGAAQGGHRTALRIMRLYWDLPALFRSPVAPA